MSAAKSPSYIPRRPGAISNRTDCSIDRGSPMNEVMRLKLAAALRECDVHASKLERGWNEKNGS